MNHKLTFQWTYAQLCAVNKMWEFVPYFDTSTSEMRMLASVSNCLAEKLVKKELTMYFRNAKTTTFKLEYHNAYFLERIIRTILPKAVARDVCHHLQHTADELHQKLA